MTMVMNENAIESVSNIPSDKVACSILQVENVLQESAPSMDSNIEATTNMQPGQQSKLDSQDDEQETKKPESPIEDVVAAVVNELSTISALEDSTLIEPQTPTGLKTPIKSATPSELDLDDDYDEEDELNTDSPNSSSNRKDDEQGNNNSSRQEKSLGLLTSKFVNLLQECKFGIMDLKMASLFLFSPSTFSISTRFSLVIVF